MGKLRASSGQWVPNVDLGESFRSFVPDSLPPQPPVDLTGARARLLEDATLSIGRLDSISMLLPDPHLFLYTYVRREAVLSSQIEGTQSSLSDLLLFELEEIPGVPLDDVVEVSNYVAALEHGIARLRSGFPLSNRLLREMHEKLLSRGRGSEKMPGEFRRSQNWIGGTRPGNAHFVPPPADRVQDCMAALERFIHDSHDGTPLLIRAALAHAQFETIHPFLDGNGRLGRLLIALILHNAGALAEPLLYLSLYFKRNRARYYERLDGVRASGDWEAWVDFFLNGVLETAQGAVKTARQLAELFERDAKRVITLGRRSGSVERALTRLRRNPVCSINDLSVATGLAFPTAASALQKLIDLGIAREMTGKRRNRIFVYDAYLGILSEGGEPV
jgi:Fic family protein